MQLVNLGVCRAATFDFNGLGLVRVLHLEFVELLSHLLVLSTQVVELLLVFANSLQKLRVGGLSGEELLHNLLDVGEASLGANVLEGLFDLGGACHLFVHLGLEEGAPELLSEEVLVHLQLIAVFVVIGGLVADLLLAKVSLHAPLERRLLVVQRFENGGKPVLSLEVILVDKPHELLQSVLRLKPRLLGLAVLLGLVHEDLLLVLVTVALLVESDLNRNQVRLHPVDHVLVGALHHHLPVVRVLNTVQLFLRCGEAMGLAAGVIFDSRLIALSLLKFALDSQKIWSRVSQRIISTSHLHGSTTYLLDLELALLGQHSFVNVVVLLADAAKGCAHLLVLLVAELPRWNHVVWLQQSVPRYEAVLGAPVVVPAQRKSSSLIKPFHSSYSP